MNISEVTAFLTVVSTKNISKAAELLFLSQSTVSSQLKALEEELGVMLLDRRKGHRQIDLTAKGEALVPIAERFVQAWQEAQALQYKNTGSLHISSVDSLNTYSFAPFYQQLLRGDPPLRLKVLTHQTPEIFEQVENRVADIGFVLSQRHYPNIITKPVFQDEMRYVRLVGSDAEAVHPSELNFSKEIYFGWGPEYAQWHNTWCNPNVQPPLQVDTITMLMMFLKDEYWTVLPASLIRVLKRRYSLLDLPIAEGPPLRTCYKLVHRFPKSAQQAAIDLFEAKLDEFLREQRHTLCLDTAVPL